MTQFFCPKSREILKSTEHLVMPADPFHSLHSEDTHNAGNSENLPE